MEHPIEANAAVRLRLAFARVGAYSLVAAPALILGQMTRLALRGHALAFDAANSYLPAAKSLLHGDSPYHPADIARGVAFASPPIAAFLFAPFTVLPSAIAEAAMAWLMLAAVLGALRLVGVRDWRCYAIVALSAPVVEEFQTANLSALIALCAALVWRYRDRATIAGAAAGVAVALKLFGWPLIVFLLATRRFRAAAWATAFAAAGILVPWAIVGFVGLGDYPHLLGQLVRAERSQVYSLGALIAPLSSWGTAQLATYLAGALLLVAALRAQTSKGTFVACVAAMLVLTPIVWMHYFVLLLVVLAVVRPVFGPLWALPLVLWLSAREGPQHTWQTVLVLTVEAFLLGYAFTQSSERGRTVRPTQTANASQQAAPAVPSSLG